MTRFEEAAKRYQTIGADAEEAIARAENIPISIQCWQGDDVKGFLNGSSLSGGIQATGNYPGRARSFRELTQDLDKAFSLIPGKKRLNLHAIYAVTDKKMDWDKLSIKEFEPWLDWALPMGVQLDFNPTFFSHPDYPDALTLSHPDKHVRDFWVRHAMACRAIAAELGRRQGSPCLYNLWIPDGLKDIPGDRLAPRERLKESLDCIFAVKYPETVVLDSLESKVFGIGLESYTVGSAEFYLGYAAKNGQIPLIDNGHYHPTENVADKLSSVLSFFPRVALHVTRPVRWDSDHVILFNDDLRELAEEIIRCGQERVLIGLDYFDAGINRVAAWVTGARNMRKALLAALLVPHQKLGEMQDAGRFTALMAFREELKTLPFGDVWEDYLSRCAMPSGEWLDVVLQYETEVLQKR